MGCRSSKPNEAKPPDEVRVRADRWRIGRLYSDDSDGTSGYLVVVKSGRVFRTETIFSVDDPPPIGDAPSIQLSERGWWLTKSPLRRDQSRLDPSCRYQMVVGYSDLDHPLTGFVEVQLLTVTPTEFTIKIPPPSLDRRPFRMTLPIAERGRLRSIDELPGYDPFVAGELVTYRRDSTSELDTLIRPSDETFGHWVGARFATVRPSKLLIGRQPPLSLRRIDPPVAEPDSQLFAQLTGRRVLARRWWPDNEIIRYRRAIVLSRLRWNRDLVATGRPMRLRNVDTAALTDQRPRPSVCEPTRPPSPKPLELPTEKGSTLWLFISRQLVEIPELVEGWSQMEVMSYRDPKLELTGQIKVGGQLRGFRLTRPIDQLVDSVQLSPPSRFIVKR